MRPLEHFIVAALPVTAGVLLITRQRPSSTIIGATFVGSQFPDLIDKPLAFYTGLIPTGRVFMHSLPIAIPFLCVVGAYGWQTNHRAPALAFVFAHLSHIIADTYQTVLNTPLTPSPDLFWPLTAPVVRPEIPHWAGPNSLNMYLWTVFSIAVLSYVLWWLLAVDNRPFARSDL